MNIKNELTINSVETKGTSSERKNQHAFYFNADNCIGCHSCESACSSKNELPSRISYRTVGYVEGGTFPEYSRLNISMACNHCDNPVCLKGCPTRAYTKHEEYGAVIHDPEVCIGCGYCTWVCPYDAPQLDPVKGVVSKCNMCVDRLEMDLQPACVSACLGKALDFGPAQKKEESSTTLLGFPSPEITNPNVFFEQKNKLPERMSRTDASGVSYQKENDRYKTVPSEETEVATTAVSALSSHENPLVFFTLVTQLAVGGTLALFLAPFFGFTVFTYQENPFAFSMVLVVLTLLQMAGLGLSTLHLGKPFFAFRALYNPRYSRVSWEIIMTGAFFHLLAALTVITVFPEINILSEFLATELIMNLLLAGCAFSGVILLVVMYRLYCVEARPFWNTVTTLISFCGTALVLGSVSLGVVFVAILGFHEASLVQDAIFLTIPTAIGFLFLLCDAVLRALLAKGSEGEKSASIKKGRTTYRYFSSLYLGSTIVGFLLSIALGANISAFANLELLQWIELTLLAIIATSLGRMLFYLQVVPLSVPRHFFSKISEN